MFHLNWYARNYVYIYGMSTFFIVTDKRSKVKRARLSETFVFRVEREISILLIYHCITFLTKGSKTTGGSIATTAHSRSAFTFCNWDVNEETV